MKKYSRDELKNELLAAGIRPSVQRLAIFEFVRNTTVHPTAEVVYNALADELGSLSLTTVYNTLKLLVDAGLLQMLTVDETYRCFDGDLSMHAHFRCNCCGKIYDFPVKDAEALLPEDAKGFKVDEVQLYMKGVCASCI